MAPPVPALRSSAEWSTTHVRRTLVNGDRMRGAAFLAIVMLLPTCSGDAGRRQERTQPPNPAPAASATPAVAEDDDLAAAVLGGLAAVATGTGDCVQLPNSRRHPAAPHAGDKPEGPLLPLRNGMRITYVVSRDSVDREQWIDVRSVDDEGATLRATWPWLGRSAERRVLWSDVAEAPCFALNFTGERSVAGPGLTWLVLSRALLEQLRTAGETELGLANESLPGTSRFVTYTGTLRRVGVGSYRLMFQDSMVDVPTITARGVLRYGNAEREVELEVVDDPGLPLLLRMCCLRSADHAVRIEVHEPGSIESALSERGRATVYGIHFEFGSAEPGDDAGPVLDEIAAALRGHDAWRVRVIGHTDAIGDARSNLELSRRRAEAVKAALIERLGGDAAARIGAAGSGETRPRADNGTVAGRAANRRVELVRESR